MKIKNLWESPKVLFQICHISGNIKSLDDFTANLTAHLICDLGKGVAVLVITCFGKLIVTFDGFKCLLLSFISRTYEDGNEHGIVPVLDFG